MELQRNSHQVYEIGYHIIFCTKYRHKVLVGEVETTCRNSIAETCLAYGWQLKELEIMPDHVHLLVSFPPTVELSRLVNSLKGVSSRYLRRDYPELAQHYWRAKRLWSGSYYAGTSGGAPLSTLKKYIQNQNRPQ